MATKRKPGKYDCYEKAGDDEPMFILLGRDPTAWLVVTLWVRLRMYLGQRVSDGQIDEARQCAQEMEHAAAARGKGVELTRLAQLMSTLGQDTLSAAEVIRRILALEQTPTPGALNPDEVRWPSDRTPNAGYRVFPWMGRWSWHCTEAHDGFETLEEAEHAARAHDRGGVVPHPIGWTIHDEMGRGFVMRKVGPGGYHTEIWLVDGGVCMSGVMRSIPLDVIDYLRAVNEPGSAARQAAPLSPA